MSGERAVFSVFVCDIISEQVDLYRAIDVVREEALNALSAKKDKKQSLFKKGALKIKNLFRGNQQDSGGLVADSDHRDSKGGDNDNDNDASSDDAS